METIKLTSPEYYPTFVTPGYYSTLTNEQLIPFKTIIDWYCIAMIKTDAISSIPWFTVRDACIEAGCIVEGAPPIPRDKLLLVRESQVPKVLEIYRGIIGDSPDIIENAEYDPYFDDNAFATIRFTTDEYKRFRSEVGSEIMYSLSVKEEDDDSEFSTLCSFTFINEEDGIHLYYKLRGQTARQYNILDNDEDTFIVRNVGIGHFFDNCGVLLVGNVKETSDLPRFEVDCDGDDLDDYSFKANLSINLGKDEPIVVDIENI